MCMIMLETEMIDEIRHKKAAPNNQLIKRSSSIAARRFKPSETSNIHNSNTFMKMNEKAGLGWVAQSYSC